MDSPRRLLAFLAVTFAALANGAPFDFTSDAKPDILFRNASSGATYLWRMNGLALASDALVTSIDPSWSLIGHGDFNGDGKNDLVWRNKATGAAYVWYMNDGVFVSDAYLFTIDPVWRIEAVADFNKDGKPDFLFRHASTGVGFIWYFNDTAPLTDQYLFSIDNQWAVEGVGDFNGDGYPDFFFRNLSSGVGFVWYWDGTSLGASNFLFAIDPVWQVAQVADWNGDGKPDLLFRNDNTGVTFVWYTDGTALQGSNFITQIDPSWKIVPREIATVVGSPPGAPASPSAVGGDRQATLTWTTGADNGNAITATTINVHANAACTDTPSIVSSACLAGFCNLTIPALVNGTSYCFKVFNTNGAGAGPLSAPSNAVVPAATPSAPTSVSALAGNAQASVSWTTGAGNGATVTGATIYRYASSSASTCSGLGGPAATTSACAAGSCTATVTSLANGTSYCFRVSNTNRVGEGSLSALGGPVTPMTVPGVAGIATTTAGASVTVTIATPAAANGSAVDSYRVDACSSNSSCGGPGSCTSGSLAGFTTTTTSAATVSSLTTCAFDSVARTATCGKTYTMCVYAHNAVGYGTAASAAGLRPKVSYVADNLRGIWAAHGCLGCHAGGKPNLNPPGDYASVVPYGTLIYLCPENGSGPTCMLTGVPYWASTSGAGQTLRQWVADGQRQ